MSGFTLLNKITETAETVISQLAVAPVATLSAGVIGIGVAAMTLYTLYQAYNIMAGLVSDPLMPLLKGWLVKFIILFIAGSSSLYLSEVGNVIKETPAAMAKDLTGETKSLNIIEDKLIVAFDGLDKLSEISEPPKDDKYEASFKGDLQRSAANLWGKFIGGVKTFTEPFSKIWSSFLIFIKLMVIMGGLMYLAIALTKVILITKTFFMLCIGVGPLFLMFAAFERTRGWFNSWLNYTLGLGMSYVMIMFSSKILLTILDKLWQDGVSWINVFASFFTCVALAIVLGRVGDIASAWFSAGNIADGTAAAVAVATGSTAGRVKGMAQTVGSNVKDAYKKYQNRGQEKMQRYNTRHSYNQNREAAAKKAEEERRRQTKVKGK